MEQSLSWEAASCAATQELPSILRSQINPVSTTPPHLSKIYFTPTYVLVFLVNFFFLAFPPISQMHSCSSPFVLPALPPWLHYSNYTWWRVQVMKFLIMQPWTVMLKLSFFFNSGLWGYWHCGHSWPIVPASSDSEDDCGETDEM
jgi:hypothetical protein